MHETQDRSSDTSAQSRSTATATSVPQRIITWLLVAFLAWSSLGVILTSTKPNVLQDAIGLEKFDYLSPLLDQNWGVFAPSINTSSTDLVVRIHYTDADGSEVSDWVNTSEAERALQLNRPGATRLARLSSQLANDLRAAYRALTPEQQAAIRTGTGVDTSDANVRAYFTIETRTLRYATLVGSTIHSGANVDAVDLGLRICYSVPFKQRNTGADPTCDEPISLGTKRPAELPASQSQERFAEVYADLFQEER